MQRSEVWLIDLNPSVGSEMQKIRPAIVVSDDRVGVLPLRVVVPLTDWKDRIVSPPGWFASLPTQAMASPKSLLLTRFKCARFLSKDLSTGLEQSLTVRWL